MVIFVTFSKQQAPLIIDVRVTKIEQNLHGYTLLYSDQNWSIAHPQSAVNYVAGNENTIARNDLARSRRGHWESLDYEGENEWVESGGWRGGPAGDLCLLLADLRAWCFSASALLLACCHTSRNLSLSLNGFTRFPTAIIYELGAHYKDC